MSGRRAEKSEEIPVCRLRMENDPFLEKGFYSLVSSQLGRRPKHQFGFLSYHLSHGVEQLRLAMQ